LIESRETHGVKDMIRIQYDVAVMSARARVPIMLQDLATCKSDQCKLAASLLEEWQEQDYIASADSRGTLVYEVFWQMFPKAVFKDELKDITGAAAGFAGLEGNALARILDDPQNIWFDNIKTRKRECRPDLMCATMERTMKYLRRNLGSDPDAWQWGHLNKISLTSTMIKIPGVMKKRLIGTFFMPGTNETVRASDSLFFKPLGFYNFVGPSTHFIVDFSKPRLILWNATSGNSENHSGDRYKNTTRAWLDRDYYTLSMDEDMFRQGSMGEVVLLP
jgi:acyl-homoserine lactone acylase PvdQ